MNRSYLPLPAALAVALLTGCGSSAADTYQGQPITLTIGTDDSPGVPSADQISHFADEVAKLSGGKITVTPKWHAEGEGGIDWDQKVAAMVQHGDLDLALGPTWAWDVLGVHTLEPIQTPFLITSDELVAKVVADENLATELMAGLPHAGVQGISLWPEGLRHPFGFDKALISPDDFAGKTVRSAKSDASAALFGALGAKASAADPDATKMVGTQSEYALSPNGVGAVNVTFFPKVNLLYANAHVYDDLDEAARSVLTRAARTTQTWAVGRADDVAAGQAFCTDGGTLVEALPDQVAALLTKTKPVVDAVKAAHPETVAAITAHATGIQPSAAATCTAATAATAEEHRPASGEAQLNGTYRLAFTPADFTAAGQSVTDAYNNAGVQTFILKDGKVTARLDPSERPFDANANDMVDGTYQVDGDVATFKFPVFDNEVDRMSFVIGPQGDLTMTWISGTNPDVALVMTSKTWEKVQ